MSRCSRVIKRKHRFPVSKREKTVNYFRHFGGIVYSSTSHMSGWVGCGKSVDHNPQEPDLDINLQGSFDQTGSMNKRIW